MKKLLLAVVFWGVVLGVRGQGTHNQFPGSGGKNIVAVAAISRGGNSIYQNKTLTGIPCNPNTFWANTSGNIEEFLITGNTITSNGVITGCDPLDNSLAWCNNLNGTFSPTFYTHHFPNLSMYYTGMGSAWSLGSSASASCPITNAGGNGNYLYYNYDAQNCIEQFDGTSFVQFYSSPGLVFTVADLAVDDAGNVWCLMGAAAPVTDSILVISPAGQVIYQFPFYMDTNNGYGTFLLNGTLFIGLGPANSLHPNVLLPITFTSTAAVAGTPLSFNAPAIDLASCNAGIPLSVIQNNLPANDLIIFPTVAADYINCVVKSKINATLNISITDPRGRNVYSSALPAPNYGLTTKIDISNFSKGIYFVEVTNGKEKTVKKFIKN
jgi:hypothetical protein